MGKCENVEMWKLEIGNWTYSAFYRVGVTL